MEETISISHQLPHIWYDGTGDLPEDLINAQIVRIGAITEGNDKGNFGIEYIPSGRQEKKLLVIYYCDVCMYLKGATFPGTNQV
jgi:hypothetical protein